jgi:hypothetical protein
VLAAVPSDVGVMSLDRRYYTFMRREALNQPNRICPLAVLDSLRTNEAKLLLSDLQVTIPSVPNTLIRSALREQFGKLNPKDVHSAMLRTLKRTRDLRPLTSLVSRLPDSLHAAALCVPLRKSDHDRLVDAVNTPLERAMVWS